MAKSILKTGCDFGCDFCPFLSTFVHSYKQRRPPKLEAFVLKILDLALYARRDSNPQPLAPEANALFFELKICLLKSYTLFSASNQIGESGEINQLKKWVRFGCDFSSKMSVFIHIPNKKSSPERESL